MFFSYNFYKPKLLKGYYGYYGLIRSYSSEEEVDTGDRNEPLGGGWNDREEDPREAPGISWMMWQEESGTWCICLLTFFLPNPTK